MRQHPPEPGDRLRLVFVFVSCRACRACRACGRARRGEAAWAGVGRHPQRWASRELGWTSVRASAASFCAQARGFSHFLSAFLMRDYCFVNVFKIMVFKLCAGTVF